MYLTNKELLAALAESKNTYCWFARPEYADYDAIVQNIKDITPECIQAAREKRALRVISDERGAQRASGVPAHRRVSGSGDVDAVTLDSLVFRVMTWAHVPKDPTRTRKSSNAGYAKTNFPPFAHYAFVDGALQEVGRSHWTGSLSNGHFDITGGQMKRRLASMFMTLVSRIANRSNYRGYSYVEEMKGSAIVHLVNIGLQFDESKGSNPFAFYTQAVNNSFLRILAMEKKNQMLRDEVLIASGQLPSHTRQLEDSLAQQQES